MGEISNIANEFAEGIQENVVTEGEGQDNGQDKVDMVGDIPTEDFKGAFSEYLSGGKGIEEIDNLVQAKSKYDELVRETANLKQGNEDLQNRLSASKIPNQFIQELIEMTNGGATEGDIKAFMSVQLVPTDGLNDAQLVKEKMRFEKPYLNPGEIDALFDEDYGAKGTEENARAKILREAKIKDAGAQAKAFFNDKKRNLSSENLTKLNQANQERRAQLKTDWGHVVETLNNKQPLKIVHAINEENLNYKFEYTPDEGEFQNRLNEALVDYAVGAGIPMDETGKQAIFEMRELLTLKEKWQEIIGHVIRDVNAKNLESTVTSNAGPIPPRSGINQEKPKPKKAAGPTLSQGYI